MKYKEFGEIIQTMENNNYDYKKNSTLNALNDRKKWKGVFYVGACKHNGICIAFKSKALETY